jgi:hypothetical protein
LAQYSDEPYENVRSTCVSCQRHNFLSFALIPSRRQMYTPGLWFLPPSRQGITKSINWEGHKIKNPLKIANFFTPQITLCASIFGGVFYYSFLSHFLCSFRICNFYLLKRMLRHLFRAANAQKWFFSKVTMEAHSTFIFCCIILLFTPKKALDLSFQELKTDWIYLNVINFYDFSCSKTPFDSKVLRTVKKIQLFWRITLERIVIS